MMYGCKLNKAPIQCFKLEEEHIYCLFICLNIKQLNEHNDIIFIIYTIHNLNNPITRIQFGNVCF